MKTTLSILLILTTIKIFSQNTQIEKCFQTILDDDFFLAEIDTEDIKYCDNTLILIEKNKLKLPLFLRNKKLNTDYDSSKNCSYLSFVVPSKNKLKVMIKSPRAKIGKTETGEVLLFDFKVKANNDECKIKNRKVKKRNYHVKLL